MKLGGTQAFRPKMRSQIAIKKPPSFYERGWLSSYSFAYGSIGVQFLYYTYYTRECLLQYLWSSVHHCQEQHHQISSLPFFFWLAAQTELKGGRKFRIIDFNLNACHLLKNGPQLTVFGQFDFLRYIKVILTQLLVRNNLYSWESTNTTTII